ncbi:MAG: SDR family NAD(P)-dependent oxidoreductase, partial [Deltaproteobacteria bacterium]
MPSASIFRPGLFEGRCAFVTGGTKGIGLAIARELKSLGAKVFIGSRRPENVASGLEALAGIPEGEAEGIAFDIRDESTVDAAIEKCKGRFGRIDFLVNNAGGQFPSPAMQMTTKGFDAVITTNLNANFSVTKAVVTRGMGGGDGAVVNITAQVTNGFPMMAHTGAARAGVENLTRTLALELAPAGVRVNAVAPGVINSSGVENYEPAFREAFLAAADH